MSETEKPTLLPADENPWYCLATIHGEQPIEGFDDDIARRNYQVWARWVGGALNDEGAERAEFERNFANRTGPKPLKIPDPNTIVDFSNTHFVRPINFLAFHFRAVDFSSAMFSGGANFSQAQFHIQTDFSSAIFSGETSFRTARVNTGSVVFQSATFSQQVDFRDAHFVEPNFKEAKFSDSANFSGAKFHGSRADFLSAIFSGVAFFDSAEFYSVADFDSATFAEATYFSSAKFFGEADFSEATFSSDIIFRDAKFKGYTIFADVRFESRVPDFRGATLHQATEWHGVTWPKPPRSKEDAQQQVYAYERLKQEMEQLKKHEDEQKFFRKELRARRGLLQTSPWEWLVNVIYGWSSDYGNSFMSPLFWLFGVFAAGTAIFSRAPLHCGVPMPIRLAFKLSFANIFVFLPDKREIMTPEMTACLSDTTRLVSAFQSVSGVVLLFLLGLALRNRFRMR